MHWAKIDVRRYLSDKRARKRLRRVGRAHDKAVARARAQRWEQAKRNNFGSRSTVIGMLAERGGKPFRTSYAQLDVSVPSVFSMFEDPECVLKWVARFAATHRAELLASVTVDFSANRQAHSCWDFVMAPTALDAAGL